MSPTIITTIAALAGLATKVAVTAILTVAGNKLLNSMNDDDEED